MKLPESSGPLADTQRAIIEAAERRGYERALAEREADARDAATSGAVADALAALEDARAYLMRCAPASDLPASEWGRVMDRTCAALARACNAHDALVEALKGIMADFEGRMADNENVEWHESWNNGIAALALAGETP